MKEQHLTNEIFYRFARGQEIGEIAGELHISRIWAMHKLADLAKDNRYLEGAHLRAKRSPWTRARIVFDEQERALVV